MNASTMEPLRAPTHRDPAVFLDKDGTLVGDLPYNVDPARLRFTALNARLANAATATMR